MPYLISILALLFSFSLQAQDVKIDGYAPTYVGERIEFYAIEDYLSMKETLLGRGEIKADSSFSVSVTIDTTQKLVIKCKRNWSFMYVQPDGNYTIIFPDKDPYDPVLPTGNAVELTFIGLDSLDINYKILGFQRWVDEFMTNTLYKVRVDTSKTSEFAQLMDKFKLDVDHFYENDDDFFFRTYIKFYFAFLENVQYTAERSQYEKYDFFLDKYPVCYNNDIYMDYLKGFYRNMLPRLTYKVNESVYQGIVKASPSLIMRSLGKEYTLKNLRIREMVMLKMLAEQFYSGDYPQTNILTVIDSIAVKGMFPQSRTIAKNLSERLTELVPGIKAPEIIFSGQNQAFRTLNDFKGKYLYIHFFNPESDQYKADMILLKDLHSRYGDIVEFVSVYESESDTSEINMDVPWPVYGLSATNNVWTRYKVKSFPFYMLIDVEGYIVSYPALAPTPNGQYETIDHTFHQIRTVIERYRRR